MGLERFSREWELRKLRSVTRLAANRRELRRRLAEIAASVEYHREVYETYFEVAAVVAREIEIAADAGDVYRVGALDSRLERVMEVVVEAAINGEVVPR